MTNMAARSLTLSTGQKWLAGLIMLLALAVTPVFFIVMFLTVNGMLGPYFDGWAWTVPVATEIVFLLLFLGAILLEWLRRPKRALWIAAYPFAVISAFLNVWAYHDSIPGMVGHLAVAAAFFIPVTFAKTGVRSLLVTDDELARAVVLADAQAHARDMLRSALGFWWHFRAPVRLRRQLRSGRLPAKVLEAVDQGARFGGATVWEPAVEAWITSAVTLPERAREQVRAARQAVPAPALEPAAGEPESTPADSVQARPRARSARASRPALKLTAAKSRGMIPERLAEHVSAMLDAYGDAVPVNRIKADLSVGTEKAKAALEIARQNRARVVQFGERKQA